MTPPRALAIIVPDYRNGSVGAIAWRHAVELSRSFEVYVLSMGVPPAPDARIHPVVLQPRRWDERRRFSHMPNALAFEWSARHALAALCRRVPIAVVWCHGHASAALTAYSLRRKHRFRIILTTHGDIRDRPPGMYPRELTWFYRCVTKPAYRRADAVQALSPYMAGWARSSGARDVRVIPNRIDPSEIGLAEVPVRTADSYQDQGKVRLLFVGSLMPVKGVDVLLRSLAILSSNAGDGARGPRYHLTLVGDGNSKACYETLAREMSLESRVRFSGFIPRRNMGCQYLRSDVLCIPSRSEPLPTVGLEGMLCAVPLAGSRTGGIPFLVEEPLAGRLAEPEDAAGLADAIRDMCRSPEDLAKRGAAAQRRALEVFSWSRIAEQLRDLAIETPPRRVGAGAG